MYLLRFYHVSHEVVFYVHLFVTMIDGLSHAGFDLTLVIEKYGDGWRSEHMNIPDQSSQTKDSFVVKIVDTYSSSHDEVETMVVFFDSKRPPHLLS